MVADTQTPSGRLNVELRTPEGSVFSGEVVKVSEVPGTKAPLGILPRHAPLVSSLSVGVTVLVDSAGTECRFVTGEGFLEINDNHVLILVDTAEDVTEIDMARADLAHQRARDRLAKVHPDLDRTRAKAALVRARLRISVGKR
ncbi:MAG: F-type H+-transporting ATPase subunit epsilon [Pseudohongiellaceae bacterium]|jgi:F-type H+-transporting ATPase subunit epsilon